jgi:hypothetical protein
MRSAAWLLLVVACNKGGGGKLGGESASGVKLAKPEDARVIAVELAKAMSTCDQGQLAGFLDFAYLASRAGGKGEFLAEANQQKLECDTPVTKLSAVVVSKPDAPKPIVRWRKGTGCTGSFGYIELTVADASPAPRIADFEAPLHPQSAVTSLKNIQSLPAGDQPGMITDIFLGPFEGVDIGDSVLARLQDEPHKLGVEKHPENLDLAMKYGFVEHDYKAVQIAANAAAKLVGEDAQLATVRITAAIGAGEAPYAQQLAREATTKWPDDIDAWCSRFAAERAAGDGAAMAEAKQVLGTKFKVER